MYVVSNALRGGKTGKPVSTMQTRPMEYLGEQRPICKVLSEMYLMHQDYDRDACRASGGEISVGQAMNDSCGDCKIALRVANRVAADLRIKF